MFKIFRRNTTSTISYIKADKWFIQFLCTDGKPAVPGHGSKCVVYYVQKNLLQLAPVANDLGQIIRHIYINKNIFQLCLFYQKHPALHQERI